MIKLIFFSKIFLECEKESIMNSKNEKASSWLSQSIMIVIFVAVAAMLILMVTKSSSCGCGSKEGFDPVTGFKYEDGCDKMPVPNNIVQSCKSPPFYDINARKPELCHYTNFTFPPPMDYPPIETCPYYDNRYQYWYTGVLSHPKTAYLV